MAQKLVASAADLEQLALDDEAPIAALQGWRRDIFGEAALALKRGELALAADGKEIAVIASVAQPGAQENRRVLIARSRGSPPPHPSTPQALSRFTEPAARSAWPKPIWRKPQMI